MQAIMFEHPGQAETVLALRDMPLPVAGKGQVLIHVAARPIQPADFLFIEGRYRIKPVYPQVAGLEGVGTIVACGSEATRLESGMRVAFRAPGAWAEFAVAPTSRVYPVPPEISDTVACQFALNPLTAWALLSECDLPKSSRLLITAGRSVVARLLTRLAQGKGLAATLLAREGDGHVALEGDTGQPIARGKNIAEVLEAIVGRQGRFQAILDAVGGANTLALMDALEPRGRLISYGILDDGEITLKASRILYKNMLWQGFGIDGWLDQASGNEVTAAQQDLWPMLAEQADLLPVIGSFTLPQIHSAINAVRTIKRPGKVLLMG